ncbi:MAG TPA: AAA family ATPase [Thermoanaerobaculia bacterium]|nr:AAA family ATPase [Thermoanaerobaculia bacterium]
MTSRPSRAQRAAEFAGTSRYRVVRRLGSGGMGEVYEVWDREWEASVALKRLTRTEPKQLARFKREFRSLAHVSHPNLVTLYELVVGDEHSMITMELVEGIDFLSWVRGRGSVSYDPSGDTLRLSPADTTVVGGDDSGRSIGMLLTEEVELPARGIVPLGSFDERRLRAIALQVSDAVGGLHGIGKLHRDLKPSNVLVTAEGRAVVLDFGLIEDFGDHEETRPEVAGTPGYMAPEQEAGERSTPATDWYGLGAMLFEAMVGIRPRSSRQLGKLVAALDPAGLPEDLWRLCCDLLRRNPESRPRASEISARLCGRWEPASLRPGGRSVAALSPLLSAGRFVGREAELGDLRRALEASRRFAKRLAVHGRSGIGKSALIEHFLGDLEREGEVVVLRGRCFEQESVPYKAFDALVEDLEELLASLAPAQIDALMPAGVDALVRVFPVVGRGRGVLVSGPRETEPEEPLLIRQRAFDALRELLRRIAERRPVVLWIDDLQWADIDSRALLNVLWRQPDAPRVLWLLSFRTEELDSRGFLRELAEPDGRPGHDVLEIGALAPQAARRLVSLWLSGEHPDRVDSLVEDLVEEAAGNTFLLQEVARHARSLEEGGRGPGVRTLDLDAVIESRLAVQPPGARRLLEVLAVGGRPLRADVAFRAAGEMREGLALVVALRAAKLLRTEGAIDRAPRQPRVEIFHDRLREVLISRLDADALRALHASLASALETAGEDEPDALYEHHLAAGNAPAAARWAEIAAQRAFEALAFGRAAAYLGRALELAPALDDDARHSLAQRQAEALAWAGRVEESARAYLDLAAQGDSVEHLEHRRAAAQQYLLAGYLDEGLAVMTEVLRAAGLDMPAAGRRALLQLAWLRLRVRVRGVRFDESSPVEISEDDLLRIDTCWAAAAGLGMVDTFRGAIFQARGLLLSLRAGEPYRVVRSLAVEAAFSASAGARGLARAERFLEGARRLAHRTQDPHAVALTHMSGGIVAFLGGDWIRALERCERAREKLEHCRGVLWERTTTDTFLLGSLQYLGRLDELAAEVPALTAAAEAQGNRNAVTDLATRFNVTWLIADDPEGARRAVDESIARWSQRGFHRQHSNALRAQVHIDLYQGDARSAWERVVSVWSDLRGSLLLGIQVLRVEMLYLRATSALAVCAGEGIQHRLRRDAESVARRLRREDAAWIRPFGLLVESGLASLAGDRTTAASRLGAAISGFEASNTHLWETAARLRLGVLEGNEGSGRREQACEWLRRRGVLDPERFAWMLAPVGAPVEPWSLS